MSVLLSVIVTDFGFICSPQNSCGIDIIDAEACKSRDWNLVRKILSGKSEPETDINGSLKELTLFQWVLQNYQLH